MPSSEHKNRRILVALDASSPRLAALEEAADLAAALGAELRGLVVEDIKLLRLAGLPCAREVASSSARIRQLDLAIVERMLRSRAEEVRWAFVAAAERVSVRWSFRIARGSMAATSLESAGDADMLIIGRERPGIHPLVPRSKPYANHPIVVAFDGRPAAKLALEMAAKLTPARDDRIAVVMVADDTQLVRRLRQSSADWMSAHGWPTASCSRSAVSAKSLAAVAGRLEARLLMVGGDSPLLGPSAVERLLELLDCPLAIVRSAEGPANQ